ncbi:MAG: hypothetical protein Kow00129_01130 [Thermoleophilia bacterium]
MRTIAAQWGYLIVFTLAFLETSAFVGLLVPGETVVLLAGAMAAEGVLDAQTLAAVVISAALLGDSAGYFLGRRFGREFLLRHERLFRLNHRRLAQADAYFARHGGKTVLFGRWVGFLRSLAPFLAGSARMSYPRFLFWDVLGASSWGLTLVALGYLAGRSYRLVESWLGRVSLFVLLLLVAAAGFWLLGRWMLRRRHLLGGIAGSVTDAMMERPWMLWVRRRFGPQIDWTLRRFSPRQAYGLVLTLGLLISVFLVWGFSILTEWVLTRGPLSEPDRRIAVILQEHAVPELTRVMVFVTYLGSGWFTIGVSVLLGVFLLWRRRLLEALLILTSAPGAWLLTAMIKPLVGRPRPDFIEPLVSAEGYAFPSGHATVAAAFYLVLGVLVAGWVRRWETRVYVLLAALALVLFVGFSRMYLGVHYLTDVLAGYVVGFFWATLAMTATTTLGRAWEQATAEEESREAA